MLHFGGKKVLHSQLYPWYKEGCAVSATLFNAMYVELQNYYCCNSYRKKRRNPFFRRYFLAKTIPWGGWKNLLRQGTRNIQEIPYLWQQQLMVLATIINTISRRWTLLPAIFSDPWTPHQQLLWWCNWKEREEEALLFLAPPKSLS